MRNVYVRKHNLGQLRRGPKTRKIFGGVHTKGPTISFRTNDCFVIVLIIGPREEVKDPVSQNESPFHFDCEILK